MLIDISKKIDKNTLVYPGDPLTEINEVCNIKNDGFRLSKLSLCLHTSTHIDFPSHFLKDGKTSSDYSDINYFIGRVIVVELNNFPKSVQGEYDSIFIKTNNKAENFPETYSSIKEAELEFLIKNNIKFIGTDFYTIEPSDSDDFYFHKELLKNNVLIIENLDLSMLNEGFYDYYIFPLKLERTEASICRIAVKKQKTLKK